MCVSQEYDGSDHLSGGANNRVHREDRSHGGGAEEGTTRGSLNVLKYKEK